MFLLVSPFTSYLDGPKRRRCYGSIRLSNFQASTVVEAAGWGRAERSRGKRSIAIYGQSSVTLCHWSAKKTRSFLGRKLISSPFPPYHSSSSSSDDYCHYNSDDSFLAKRKAEVSLLEIVLHSVQLVHYLILINLDQSGLPAEKSLLEARPPTF